MDTGGLAQMTYNNFPTENTLGVPGSGFASRGKGANIKRLNFAPPSNINSIHEEDIDANSATLRSNRSQLLAGLRTAPKQQSVPASAPYNQNHFRFPSDVSGYNGRSNVRLGQDVPHSAINPTFSGQAYNYNAYTNGPQNYCLPDQVLAPPDLAGSNNEHMDPQLYNELMATNMYLVQRQEQLQKQLLHVTAAAQQLQGLSLNGNAQFASSTMAPHMSTYNQQLQNGVQPIVQPAHNQPGLYTVYNPLTGQTSYYFDQSAQGQLSASPPYSGSSPDLDDANYPQQDSLSLQATQGGRRPNSSTTPPKKSDSPTDDVAPLPPPSATAFRPGHRKAASIGYSAAGNKPLPEIALRSPNPRSSAFAPTPTTGSFGPGMGRAGEHPSRQPRGPPPLEELMAAPTSKHDGSKNFATRQRRRALNSLVRAGNERRSGRGTNGSGTPASEGEMNFTVTSEADSDSVSNGLYGLGAGLRGTASGAIGSEWKELKERSRERGMASRHLAGSSYGGNEGGFGGR